MSGRRGIVLAVAAGVVALAAVCGGPVAKPFYLNRDVTRRQQ